MVSAVVVDYFRSRLHTEVLLGGGSLPSQAEDRLRRYFGSLLDTLLIDEAAAELDRQRKKEHRRAKNKESLRGRRVAESADERNARLDAQNASKKESRRAAANVALAYRTTAHVTRLYQSSNPADPLVFHGNTCPKRPFPATPSRHSKETDLSTPIIPIYKAFDAMAVDDSPSSATTSALPIRKTSPSTPTSPTRLTRANRTGAGSSETLAPLNQTVHVSSIQSRLWLCSD
ncbi:hypothetical protein FRC01_014340 [Tulasnella sp. 417]|nr:hypothetical protein FRC01_014340 [Tulasnella sp. 417]